MNQYPKTLRGQWRRPDYGGKTPELKYKGQADRGNLLPDPNPER